VDSKIQNLTEAEFESTPLWEAQCCFFELHKAVTGKVMGYRPGASTSDESWLMTASRKSFLSSIAMEKLSSSAIMGHSCEVEE
jgi:hypothetical protein